MDGPRGLLPFKPRQECLILGVISHTVHSHGKGSIGQVFHHITSLQQILTVAVWSHPPGSNAMHTVCGHKRVVHGFRDLMADRRYVLKVVTKKDERRDP